jgi:hypothetical protein
MELNSTANLPDFDDMDRMARIIADAKARLEDTKNKLDEYIAQCTQMALTNQDYWINNKPPSAAYCKTVISVVGNHKADAERIIELKNQIVEYQKLYQESKQILEHMRDRIEVWRTVQANGRKVNI